MNVTVKGTVKGTSTDANGNFEIDANEGDVLSISGVGFETAEVTVGSGAIVSVVLKQSEKKLEEVIVVGYGTQKKVTVTGAVTQVKGTDLDKSPSTNLSNSLAGRLPGITAMQRSGEPGYDGSTIRIRGTNTLGNSSPLVVIDGVPDRAGGLERLNPADIESMSVLKDASAAIYGARAANGVIVITTKKGKDGKSEMNLSVSTAMATLSNKMDVFNADAFRQQVVSAGGTLLDGGANTDCQDELTRTAVSKNINFSMSGGAADKFSYYVSTGVDDQKGIFNTSSLKRYSGRVNLTQKALDGRFNVDFNLTASRTVNDRPDIGGMTVDMLQLNPTIPVYTNGEPTLFDDRLNPVVRNQIYSDVANSNRILANIAPSLEIFKGLTYRANLGVDYSATDRDVQTNPYPILESLVEGTLDSYYTNNRNSLVENTLTYAYDQGDHNFTLLAGHSYQEIYVQQKRFNMRGFAVNDIDPKFQDQISSPENPTTMTTYAYKNELQSFFGRLNYGYADKYLLTATMRADGSSKFGANNKYGYFPSVAVGWNISKEDAFADSDVVNNLKLRASWGHTGNQEGIDNKVSLASYIDSKADNDTYPLDPNADSIDDYPFGTVPARTANPDLKWEVSTQTNIGLDFGLFGNKLTGTLDYFNKVTSDVVLLANRIDPIQPTPKIWTNIPDMEIINTGIELALDYRLSLGEDLMLNLGGNMSFTENKVENSQFEVITTGAAQGAGQTGATINGYLNNEPVGSFYMKEFTGIGADGLNQYRDVNGDGEILDNDRIVVGSALPDIIYAFYFKLNYKDFDLGLNFNGVSGNKILNHTAMSLFSKGQLSRNLNTTDFAVQFPNEDNSNSNEVSTRYLEDGSFLRLNNATLGYNLNPSKLGFGDLVSNVRFTLTGQNLFVVTDYSGFDPEINTGTTIDGIQTFGIDRFTYP